MAKSYHDGLTPYVACVARRILWLILGRLSLLQGEEVLPLFLPEALVYRHDVALGGEYVLVLRLVQRVVLIKELQKKCSSFNVPGECQVTDWAKCRKYMGLLSPSRLSLGCRAIKKVIELR